jgi:glycosyltransferase involved in cell wall biosynthesis
VPIPFWKTGETEEPVLINTMKIALCKSQFFGPVSGADETLVTYAVRLHEAGQDISVVLLYKPSASDPYQERLRRAGVPTSYIIRRSFAFAVLRTIRKIVSGLFLLVLLIPRSETRLRRIWQVMMDWISRFHYRDCRAYFSRAPFDVLHVFTPDIGAALMIRAGEESGIPVLYHELGTPRHLPALDQYYQRLERVLPLCSEVAALSPILASQWSTRFPFLPSVSVLPLIAEDCETISLAVKQRAGHNEEIVFGYAARIEPGKGPLVLVDALARLQEDGRPKSRVLVAGTGPELQRVKARVRDLGLSDVWDFVGSYVGPLGCTAFMRSLDVFVLPSFAEGTSNSVIEAMAHGLPIIASNVGGLPDLLTEEAGILVPSGDSVALAEAMKRLACDAELRARLGRAARERYLKLFSPNAVLPMLSNTYSRVAGSRAQSVLIKSSHGGHPWESNGNGKHSEEAVLELLPGFAQ